MRPNKIQLAKKHQKARFRLTRVRKFHFITDPWFGYIPEKEIPYPKYEYDVKKKNLSKELFKWRELNYLPEPQKAEVAINNLIRLLYSVPINDNNQYHYCPSSNHDKEE